MQAEYITQLLNGKNYDEKLLAFIIELLPEMISTYGEEKTIIFLNEYTFVPRNYLGKNSGATNKDKKTIEFDWFAKNKHEALTLLIHEAGHAIGSLEAAKDHILMEGHLYRESFLNKLEEAVVSQKQDELEFGELNYIYAVINNYENGEDEHHNNFKTQPSQKYTINKVFYQNLMILLEKSRFLVNELMYEDSLEFKNKILERIIEIIKNTLNENELAILKDCIAVFVLNYSYRGDKTTIADYLKNQKNFDEEMSEEEYRNLLIQNFPKNIKYAKERQLFSRNIFKAVDDLCGITLNSLIRNFSNNKQSDLDNIIDACEYFAKIFSTSEQNSAKTEILKNLLVEKIKKLNPAIYYSFIDSEFSKDDFIDVFSKIISSNNFKRENLETIVFDKEKLKIYVGELSEYTIKKKPIYSKEEYVFEGVNDENTVPIGYEIELSVINKSNLHSKKY